MWKINCKIKWDWEIKNKPLELDYINEKSIGNLIRIKSIFYILIILIISDKLIIKNIKTKNNWK